MSISLAALELLSGLAKVRRIVLYFNAAALSYGSFCIS
jgi:hypothetical protein